MDLNIPTQDKLPASMWGKTAWEFLDIMVLTYPRENPPITKRDAMHNLFDSLGELLPCPDCRNHYKQFLSDNSLLYALESRTKLLTFYFKLKQEVSKNTGKKKFNSINEMWYQILVKYQLWKPKAKINPVVHLQALARPEPAQPNVNIPVRKFVKAIPMSVKTCNCSK